MFRLLIQTAMFLIPETEILLILRKTEGLEKQDTWTTSYQGNLHGSSWCHKAELWTNFVKMFLLAYLFNKENKLADLLYFLFSFPANRMNGKQQQRK